MPQGVRDGEPRHVVHRLPLEKGLPEIYRLSVSTLASRHRCLSPEIRGRGIILHAFGFSSAQSRNCPLSSGPTPPLSSTEPVQLWKKPKDSGVTFLHCRPGFQVLPRHSHRSPFLGNSSAAKQCKDKIDLEISPVLFFFAVWFSVASFYVL